MPDYAKLKELLNEHYSWPGPYVFKFIVKPAHVEELKSMFADAEIAEKQSSKGNYLSLTVTITCQSSEQIIDIYQRAQQIKSVITL